MANRKVLFRSAANINEVSPSADSILIASIDQGATTFTLKTAGTTLYSVATSGLMTMNGDFSLVPATDDTGTIGVDPAESGGDPLSIGSVRKFHLVRARKIKSGSTITLENSIDITNSADGVSAASTGRIKYESATQALRASENGGALDDFVLRTKAQTLTNKTFTAPSISDFTSSQHSHQNAAGGGQLDHGLALTGLADDDHTQYALLVGRAGGQLLRGGTAAGEDLQLQSTSHGTRGRVIAVDQLATTSTATKSALQVGSVAGDPSSIADGDVWFNSTAVRFRAREGGVSKNLIGGRTALWGEFDFDTDTTATDPGTGDVKFNSATPASVTAIYISQTTDAGFDAENFLDALATGDVIYIQDEDNATKFWRGTVSGALTDNGAWWTIPVTYVDGGAGGLFANNDNLLVALLFAGAGTGGSTLQQAYDAGATITTDASGDILFTRGAAAAVGDELLHLVDANASISRTAALLFVEDANAGSGVTCRFVRTAGTDGVALIEGNSVRTLAIRNQSANTDAVVVDTVNARLGINRIAGVAAFVPAFDIHYQSQAGNGSIVIDLYSDNGGENFEIIGRKARGTVGVPAALTDDDDMFEFGAYGHNGTTWSPQAAAILFESAGTWSGTNNGTRQVYKTTENGATVLREVFVLGDDGCVIVTGETNGLIGAVSGEHLRVVGNARVQGTVGAFTGTEANPTSMLSGSTVLLGAGAASTPDVRWRRVSAGLSIFDNNTAKRPFIVDATNNRIGGSSIDDAFVPAFDIDFEKQGAALQAGLTAYGALTEVFGRRANGTKATPTVSVASDVMFRLTGDGWDGDSFEIGAQADFVSTETWSATARGSRLAFYTTPNTTTTLLERFRIDQNGNLVMTGDNDIVPGTDNQGDLGTSSFRWARAAINQFDIYAGAGDANPGGRIGFGGWQAGPGGASAFDSRLTRPGVSQFRMDDNASGAGILFNLVAGSVGIESADGAAFAVSGASTGRLRYNNSTGTWQYSTQGGAYASFPTGSGAANTIPKWTAGGVLGNSVLVADANDRTLTYTPAASVSGSPVILTVVGPAHTGLTAAEASDINFNLARSVQFTTGATIAAQRTVRFMAATYTATTPTQTITTAGTVAISGPPIAGTNVAITNPRSLWVQSGTSQFDGDVRIPGFNLYSDRYILGADLSLIPVAGGQSVVTTWWGMQLVGNKQSTVEYTPSNLGGASDFSVAIPCQQAGAIGLLIRGQTAQTGNLLQFNNIGGTGLSCVDEVGRLGIGTVAPTADVHIVQQVATTGSPTGILFTGAAHTTLTAAEATDLNFNLARTVQFTTGGTIAAQRAVRFQAPTYAASAATQTITDAATVTISGAPAQGTNVVLTRTWALDVEAGSSLFRGDAVLLNTNLDFRAAIGDANPTARLSGAGLLLGAGGGSALDARVRRTAASTFTIDNGSTGGATIVPATTNTGVIGTDSLKWNRIRATSVVTGDLEMKDEAKGVHYVLIEEKDGIYVKDMVKKKMFKIPMVEVPWRN